MNDEFAGQGGSYVIDPVTGTRKLVQRTEYAPAAVQPDAPAAPVAQPVAE